MDFVLMKAAILVLEILLIVKMSLFLVLMCSLVVMQIIEHLCPWKDFIQGINGTGIYAEKLYKHNFTSPYKKFVLSLLYNGDDS